MMRFLNWVIVAGICLSAAGTARATFITNGDFESPTGTNASTTTFPGWTESVGSGGLAGDTAVVAAVALSGSVSARLVTDKGNLKQSVSPLDTFQFDLDFAMPDTGGVGNRGLSIFLIGRNSANTADGQINLRVVRGSTTALGTLQAFRGSDSTWNTLVADAVNFSTSLATPVTNHLTISGNFTSGSTYTATVNSVSSSAANFFQANTPVTLHTVTFSSDFSQVDWVADNVVVTGTEVPEPTGLALLAVAAFTLFPRRRR